MDRKKPHMALPAVNRMVNGSCRIKRLSSTVAVTFVKTARDIIQKQDVARGLFIKKVLILVLHPGPDWFIFETIIQSVYKFVFFRIF